MMKQKYIQQKMLPFSAFCYDIKLQYKTTWHLQTNTSGKNKKIPMDEKSLDYNVYYCEYQTYKQHLLTNS